MAILRLAGIYGPGRGPFEKIRRGTARRIVKPGQIFNRIHVDDIAAMVEAALSLCADGLFNGVDDEPAPPEDVLAYAARLEVLEVFEHYYDRTSGELRYGWQASLVRTLFGPQANRGGWNREKALAVAAYLRNQPPSR